MMLDLKLNYEEIKLLHDILDDCISDLRMEISDTHDKNFKEDLKKKELFLKKIVAELKEISAPEPVI